MGKTHALLHGHRVPVVGSICCDQIFIRVTDVPEAAPGDEVILAGRQDDEEIMPDALGSSIGTSACEAFNMFRGRSPRLYTTGEKSLKENIYGQQ